MVTRRTMLKGTAAGSIAAIASAHGVATAADNSLASLGYGGLDGGALGAFQKFQKGYSAFFKFQKAAAEIVYLEDAGNIEVFIKHFNKGWGAFQKHDVLEGVGLVDASVGFYKLEVDGVGIFFKVGGESLLDLNFDANGELIGGEGALE